MGLPIPFTMQPDRTHARTHALSSRRGFLTGANCPEALKVMIRGREAGCTLSLPTKTLLLCPSVPPHSTLAGASHRTVTPREGST